ncbi:head-tail adaptor protein [Sulfitobacter geojensis]|uniref:head-tail adaptor protein n=1 Tax=Sulfitobacter geojensis TaxID=1342299 RepID=UPI0007D915EC|nr:head-tail adaptor protein [Sulfitobacter geojensis]OAN94467.1 phage tail protein [Sulfitobacter geojensis]
MSTPRLTHPLELEAPERVSDGAGGFTENWVVLGTHWAQLVARSGRETASRGTAVSRVGYKIIVRSVPLGSVQRPKPQQRFRTGTRVFTIQAVADYDAACRYLTCFAEEEVVV